MKKTLTLTLLLFLLHGVPPVFANEIWQLTQARKTVAAQPAASNYLTYRADEKALRATLTTPARGSERILELPMPDGSFRRFRVAVTPIFPLPLAEKYPEISTYTAYAIDNENVTAKLDFTVYGFHAMVYDGEYTSLVNPEGNDNTGNYIVYYKRDEICKAIGGCTTIDKRHSININNTAQAPRITSGEQKLVNGYVQHKYRLALSCTHQYAQAVTGAASPTVAQVLSKMTTTMNRVNGIYERELSITMVFVAKEDTLIFPVETGDPFGSNNFNLGALLQLNQDVCDTLIGDANYDVGHIFSTDSAGGLSQLGVICQSGSKAQSATGKKDPSGDGFDVDYVSHEMGHEYGADHTFNNNIDRGCNGNAVQDMAFEPGSGSTIMAYAGLCSPDNVQAHSDAYFHAATLRQIQYYITTGGNSCGIKVPTNNKQPGVATFSASYTIPYRTPFELTAPTAADSTGDAMVSYCWEQWDRGDFGKKLDSTKIYGPLFRSYSPVKSPTRIFPNLRMIRSGTLSNAGVDNASGEKVPDVARSLKFKLAVRNIHNGLGCFALPDDSVDLKVINTGGSGFMVTSQNTNGITYTGSTEQTINWDVAGSNAAPINTANVDIYMSADSGYTWPFHLGTFPNNGAATVMLPNPDSTINAARIKVKGTGNVFFNINSRDFRVMRNFETSVKMYPSPAHSTLRIAADKTGILQVAVYDMVGKLAWSGDINTTIDLPVYAWARGVYVVKLIDNNGRKVVRKVLVD